MLTLDQTIVLPSATSRSFQSIHQTGTLQHPPSLPFGVCGGISPPRRGGAGGSPPIVQSFANSSQFLNPALITDKPILQDFLISFGKLYPLPQTPLTLVSDKH